MSKGIFTDKNYKPSIAEVYEQLGPTKKIWEQIISFIEKQGKSKAELKFYGKNYGWALRFTKSGKSLLALYPSQNGFTVQIILNSQQEAEALRQKIGTRIKKIIIGTPEIHEGKWLYIEMKDAQDLNDIENLIQVRAGVHASFK